MAIGQARVDRVVSFNHDADRRVVRPGALAAVAGTVQDLAERGTQKSRVARIDLGQPVHRGLGILERNNISFRFFEFPVLFVHAAPARPPSRRPAALRALGRACLAVRLPAAGADGQSAPCAVASGRGARRQPGRCPPA
ncbi:hypothetical protein G6F68_010831 [Rhizopus microsporus]|nr:hypothetical protein G6F68_010831 [Rhizopus microsporus]